MKKKQISQSIVMAGFIATLTATGNPQAAVNVTYNNTVYTVDKTASTYNNPTFSYSSQPWWGNVAAADFFAQSVGFQLGNPNFAIEPPYLATSVNLGSNIVSARRYPRDILGRTITNNVSFATNALFWMLYVTGSAPVLAIQNKAEFDLTLSSAGQGAYAAGTTLPNLSFEGAHHRTLLDNGLAAGIGRGYGMWATADTAKYKEISSKTGLGEIGLYMDTGTGENVMRSGLGVGKLRHNQSLALNGKVENGGQYLIGEIDRAFGPKLLGSITFYYGSFDTRITRNYTTSLGLDTSIGKTRTTTKAVRLRLDFADAGSIGGIELSPYLAYTLSHTKVGAYTETGGAFPASYNGGSNMNSMIRAGLEMKKDLGGANRLVVNSQLVHAIGDGSLAISGNISGVGPYSVAGSGVRRNWARLTADIDHTLSDKSVATVGFNVGTRGLGPSYGVTIGFRRAF